MNDRMNDRMDEKPKTNDEATYEIQKKRLIDVKPTDELDVKVVIGQIGELESFEDLIKGYIKLGYNLIGNVSISNGSIIATMIYEPSKKKR